MSFAFGAADAWAAAVYGEPHPDTVAFLQNQFNVLNSPTKSALTEVGKRFFQAGLNAFNHYNGAEAIRYARSVISKMNGAIDSEYIIPCTTLDALRNASLVNQRWIMAHAKMRQDYLAQRCDGYSDTYYSPDPAGVGPKHYDYRRATDGLLQTVGEDDVFINYFDELREGDRQRTIGEQAAIQYTWAAIDLIRAMTTEDLSSKSGGSL